MADKITRKYSLSASGILSVDGDGNIYLSVEGNDDINLADLLQDFDEKSVKISINYDEEYTADNDVADDDVV